MQKISSEYKKLLNDYLNKIKHSNKIRKSKVIGILLFGSLAKGKELPFPKSDIDLIVVCEDLPKDFFKRAEYVRNIEKGFSIIQSIWMTPKEFLDHIKARAGYILDAIHDGKIVYDREGFMKRTIEEAKKELRERGVKRIDGCWIWPIKKAGDVIEL